LLQLLQFEKTLEQETKMHTRQVLAAVLLQAAARELLVRRQVREMRRVQKMLER
jgi:hypothetical protein